MAADFTGDGDEVAEGATREAEALAWRALTSPRTLGVLLALAATWLSVAAFVPQRATTQELLARMSFPVGDAARSIGLADALTTWPALLLAVLIAMNLAGMAFRSASARSRSREEPLPRGPFVASAAATLDLPLALARPRLAAAMGARPREHGAGASLVAVRGRWAEGLGLLLLGALALGGSLIVDRSAALEARITTIPGSLDDSESVRTRVRHGDLWLDQQLPFDVTCAPPDPLDPARVAACTYRTAGGTVEARVGPGYPAEVDGATIRLEDGMTTLPLSGMANRFLLKTAADAGWSRLDLGTGTPMKLGGGDYTLVAVPAPDGPLVIATHGTGRPVLLGPRVDGAGPTPALGGLQLAWIPEQTVTISVQTAPGAPLLIVGLIALALGCLVLALVPQLQVTLTPRGGDRTHVQVISANRAALPAAFLAALIRATSAPEAP